MAACTEFTCSHCAFKVEAWDDGNRYLTDSEGTRHFFYHPGDITGMRIFAEEQMLSPLTEDEYSAFLEERGGNEGDYLCMNCGRQTRRDRKRDSMLCTGCGKPKLRDKCKLEGLTCPKCGKGTFHGEMTGIS